MGRVPFGAKGPHPRSPVAASGWSPREGFCMKTEFSASRLRVAILAGAVSMLALGANSAGAQTVPASGPAASDAPASEIVVSGLRASLSRSIDAKRKSDMVIDSISSEDIGKFPDTNVAESLQRITGVSIDRSGGEGRFVTVRGFGPQFNQLLLNGRTLATENPGRQFSFDLLPADLVSGADVYKTTVADVQEGGIGSTINLRTARPFDSHGQKIVLSAKADYESLSKKASPDLFGLYSNTFMDGRLGILISASYQERKTRVDTAADDGYYKTSVGGAGGSPVYSNVFMPQDYNQYSDSEDRKRYTVNATIQYRPSDTLTLTLDGLYNKFKVESVTNQVGHFFSPANLTNVVLDPGRTVVGFNQDATGHTDYVARTFNRPTDLKSVGFNAVWQPSDKIDVAFDSAYSKAQDNNGGNEIFAVIGFNNPIAYDGSAAGLPSLTAANGFTDPSVGHAHFATRQGSNYGETVYENRLDATFRNDSGVLKSIKIGAIYTDRKKTNQLIQTSSNTWCLYCGYAIPVAQGLLQGFNPSGFLSGVAGNFPRQWLSFNPEAYFTFLQSQAAANAQDAATGQPIGTTYAQLQRTNGYAGQPQPSSFAVHEKVAGGYAQINFAGEVGGLPWTAVLGARYVHTELTSSGTNQPLLDLLTVANDPTIYNGVFAQSPTPTTQSTTYDNFLPTLNVKVELSRSMILRFGASQTVTRPNLTDVAPQLSYTTLRPGNLQAAGGNPALKPYKATNFDLSYEWYYQKAGFFTVGLFYKKLNDFIVSALSPEQFQIANSQNLAAFPNGQATINVLRPRNIGDADVYGAEVGFQHNFTYLPAPLDGLGVTLNATFVKSSAASGTAGAAPLFALEGLGNSQNAVLFYEKGPVQFRVAYNHRDKFLSQQASPVGGDPVYTRAAGQVDLQAAFAVTPMVSLVAEGINVNNAAVQTYDGTVNKFLSYTRTGPRYEFGVRAKF
eukprot:gene6444-6511_t